MCPHLLGSLNAQVASQPATEAELQGPPTCHGRWEALHTVLVRGLAQGPELPRLLETEARWTPWQPHSHIRIGNPRRHKGPYSEPWGSRSRWQAGAPDGPLGRTCPGPLPSAGSLRTESRPQPETLSPVGLLPTRSLASGDPRA